MGELVFVKTTFICENVKVRVPSEMKRESLIRDNGIVEDEETNRELLFGWHFSQFGRCVEAGSLGPRMAALE